MPKAKIRTVVLGVGAMGRNHLKRLAEIPEARIVGVADVSAENAERAGRAYDVPWSTNVSEIIEKTKPIAATIASPHPTHLAIAQMCFKKGLHVFTDKPMTSLVSEADKMIAAARKAKRILAVMFQFRAAIATRRAKELLDKGAIGEIRRVSLFDVCHRTTAYYKEVPWRGTWRDEGGGVLMNQSPHALDWAIYLSMMPSKVIGRCATIGHPIETEDWADALLEYPNGATGYLCATTSEAPGMSRLEISGDRGRLVIENHNQLRYGRLKQGCRRFTSSAKGAWDKLPVTWKDVDLTPRRGEVMHHGVCLRDFCVAIQKGRKPMVTGEDARRSLELANAIILSSFNGEAVDLPVSRKAYDRLYAFLCKRGRGKKLQETAKAWRRAKKRVN